MQLNEAKTTIIMGFFSYNWGIFKINYSIAFRDPFQIDGWIDRSLLIPLEFALGKLRINVWTEDVSRELDV